MVNVSEKAQKKLGRTAMEDLQKDGYILSEREIISTPVPTKEVKTPVVLHFKYGELATPDVDDLLDGGVDPDHISRINQSGFDKPEQACAWLRHLRTLKLSNQGIRFLRATGKATNKKGANLFIREVKANAPKEQKAIEDNKLLKLAKTHQSFADPSIEEAIKERQRVFTACADIKARNDAGQYLAAKKVLEDAAKEVEELRGKKMGLGAFKKAIETHQF